MRLFIDDLVTLSRRPKDKSTTNHRTGQAQEHIFMAASCRNCAYFKPSRNLVFVFKLKQYATLSISKYKLYICSDFPVFVTLF